RHATTEEVGASAVDDFREQWTNYSYTSGFFGSADLFNDFLSPLLADRDLQGCRVAEIGSGTGRFVNVIAAAGASHLVALEPSQAMRVLRDETAPFRDRIAYLETTGDRLPASGDLGYVIS